MTMTENSYGGKCRLSESEVDIMKIVLESNNLSHFELCDVLKGVEDVAVLDEFAKDKEYGVRKTVAMSKYTSTETLNRLARDEERGIRAAIAENKNTDMETLKYLLNDKSEYVLRALAYNDKVKNNIEMLKALTQCYDEYTRDNAKRTLERLGVSIKTEVYILMYYYTGSPIYNNEGCVYGIYSTYEKAKDALQEKLKEYVEYEDLGKEYEGIYEAKDEYGFYTYYTIESEEVN